MQPEIPMRDQRYKEGCYQNQIYQPWTQQILPNPTSRNIFNMRCFTEYQVFTQREMRPILVFLHREGDPEAQRLLREVLIPCFYGTQTRLLVVNVDRIPDVWYNYRNTVRRLPALVWTFRGKVSRILDDFSRRSRIVSFALSTNGEKRWRNKGFYRTMGE